MLTFLLLCSLPPVWLWHVHSLTAHRRHKAEYTVTRACSWLFVILGPLAAVGIVWAVVAVNS